MKVYESVRKHRAFTLKAAHFFGRNKEAKKSSETDKQRTLNIKEAGAIGKRLFPCFSSGQKPYVIQHLCRTPSPHKSKITCRYERIFLKIESISHSMVPYHHYQSYVLLRRRES